MTVEQRLERLERRNRLLTWGLAVVVVLGLVATWFARELPDVVQARAVHVVRNDGMHLVELGTTIGGAGMIATYDSQANQLVQLAATVGGQGVVAIHSGQGTPVVHLGATESGAGLVTTYDGQGKELVELTTTSNEMGAVVVFDPSSPSRQGLLTPGP